MGGLIAAANDTSSEEQSAASLGDVEKSIAETRAQLDALDRDMAANRERRAELERAVARAESRADERRLRIEGLDKDIAEYAQRLATLEARVASAEAGVDARKRLLADTIRRVHQLDSNSGLKVLLGHADPATADRIAVYSDHLLRAQQALIDSEIEALAAIDAARLVAAKDRNWLEYIRNKASAQRDAVETERRKHSQALGDVDARLETQQRTVAELKADEARLQTLFDELKHLASRRSGYFELGKGNYPLPTEGKITAHFGDVKSVGRVRWKGMFIAAPLARPVRAIADGEVVLSRFIEGFGMTLFIDHGDNYLTLYGGNSRILVQEGDWVKGGAEIATVGNSGGQKTSGVYLEIRHESMAIDPSDWLFDAKSTLSAQK